MASLEELQRLHALNCIHQDIHAANFLVQKIKHTQADKNPYLATLIDFDRCINVGELADCTEVPTTLWAPERCDISQQNLLLGNFSQDIASFAQILNDYLSQWICKLLSKLVNPQWSYERELLANSQLIIYQGMSEESYRPSSEDMYKVLNNFYQALMARQDIISDEKTINGLRLLRKKNQLPQSDPDDATTTTQMVKAQLESKCAVTANGY